MIPSPGLCGPDEIVPPGDDADAEELVPPGPLWRHALWVAGMTVIGVGLGSIGSSFRIGPEEYGLPPAAPGAVWPYLIAWTVTGLVAATVLRATATRVPLYSPAGIAVVLVLLGTRISLGWRPEALALGALAAAALVATAVWCALALRAGSRKRGVTS